MTEIKMSDKNILPLSKKANTQLGNIHAAARGLLAVKYLQQCKQPLIAITSDTQSANQLEAECRFFLADKSKVLRLPDWETLPYDHFSAHEDIISARLRVLANLPHLHDAIIVIPVSSFLQRVSPQDFMAQRSFHLQIGDKINTDSLRKRLTNSGYHCVDQVFSHGEFAVRGAIIDIFPMGSEQPFRLDLFDDEIETIRLFDAESQRSDEKVDAINLLPGREFPFDDEAIKRFREQWREQFHGNPTNCPIYQDVSQGICPQGVEYYFPLFFDNTSTLFDYLPQNSLILQCGDLQTAIQNNWNEINHRYEQLRHDVQRPILPPAQLYLSANDFLTHLKTQQKIILQQQSLCADSNKGLYNLDFSAMPDVAANNNLKKPLNHLTKVISDKPRVLFTAESAGRLQNLQKLLQQAEIETKPCISWTAFCKSSDNIMITIANLDHGLMTADFAIITEAEILGNKVLQRRRRHKSSINPETLIRNLAELKVGDAIVHIDHGVGKYLGLQTLDLGNRQGEFLCLAYADNDKLYVPVTNLDLISHYTGTENPHIHRLSGDQWSKAKKKALKKVEDVAAELLDIYARREAKKGFAYKVDEAAFAKFSDDFPFEETDDQLSAIEAIKIDMSSNKPTDRLVCGDVGFGKTEVAMRAAFIAVQNHKQVAVLVPTTLLAQQHFQSFQDRFANWPVNIEMLSRFRSPKEQAAIIDKLSDGKMDIVIGTHKLLQQDVKFKDLGLLILDEEHRFGVKQKEKIKSLRAEVDILALTATPIPRTLNLSLNAIRDLSIIGTPPAKRLSIKTFVQKQSPAIIVEAIRREILRGGQVFFLHNDVATIQNTADEIAKLLPEARVDIGHGQMSERKLEKVMSDFYHRKFNVLVCSTIIETGIDIPSANTIIINRADKFGLAQLHQLRGRVGRSHHQAYAYLLIPDRVTKDAQKRLEAIQSLQDLGSGYLLATHDLEIRGTGELLGDEQSGHISEVGFNVYMDMLNAAVESLKAGKSLAAEQSLKPHIDIDVGLSALLPESYIPNAYLRLQCYKRLSSIKTLEELDDIQAEMIDRFGLLPIEGKTLLLLSEIRLLVADMGIKKIEANQQGGSIQFLPNANVDPKRLITLIQKKPETYQLKGPEKLVFNLSSNPEQRVSTLKALINQLK